MAREKFRRRTALKVVSAGIAGLLSSASVSGSRSSINPSRVNWNNDKEVLQFANRVSKLDEHSQEKIVENLSIEQEEK